MDFPKRKLNRLTHHDYSQPGGYFITVCTKDREPLFWDMSKARETHHPVGADIIRPNTRETNDLPLSGIGQIVDRAIRNIPEIYRGVTVEKYVVMPNHVHLLLMIGHGRIISAPTISTIIGGMKRWVSRQCGRPIWQKGFYDHIIRDHNDFLTKWTYIDTNPACWREDEYCEE